MGFNVVNLLAEEYDIDLSRTKFEALYGSGIIEGEKVILVKPQTYMNASGRSVIEFVKFYKLQLNDLIVIYDDMDIDISKIRIRKSGSPGGHNGMKSIVNILADDRFPRIRVGIGKPKVEEDYINYVIGAIPEDEVLKLDEGTEKAKDAVFEFIKNGIDITMNKYN